MKKKNNKKKLIIILIAVLVAAAISIIIEIDIKQKINDGDEYEVNNSIKHNKICKDSICLTDIEITFDDEAEYISGNIENVGKKDIPESEMILVLTKKNGEKKDIKYETPKLKPNKKEIFEYQTYADDELIKTKSINIKSIKVLNSKKTSK